MDPAPLLDPRLSSLIGPIFVVLLFAGGLILATVRTYRSFREAVGEVVDAALKEHLAAERVWQEGVTERQEQMAEALADVRAEVRDIKDRLP